MILLVALSSLRCTGCAKNLRLSRMSRALGIVVGVAGGYIVGHALRQQPWIANLTAIAITVALVATVVSLACAKLRVTSEDGIEVDLHSSDSR
jgi:hypothetical protein